VFRSIVKLQAAINRFIAESNETAKPFVWTKDPDRVIAAVKRAPSGSFDPLDQSAFNRHRLNAEKLLVFKSLEQLPASCRTRVALEEVIV
jgi:hypothetical protein